MFNRVHFSSIKMDWPTPQKIYDQLDGEFHFDLDACANKDNAKCPHFISPEQDALAIEWPGTSIFCNPPYGRMNGGILRWVRKAYEESQKGKIIVMFIPARTDTRYFHQYCTKGQIRFLDHRVKFDGKNNAPFPSMIVIFGGST